MSRLWVSQAEPDLQAAFAEAERVVGAAFSRVVGRSACPPPAKLGKNPDEAVSQWVEWWVEIPAPFESLSCEVLLLLTHDGPEVSGKIAAWKYLGHGFSDDAAVWEFEAQMVESPAAATAAVRRVTAELARQLGTLDLRPYLAGKQG